MIDQAELTDGVDLALAVIDFAFPAAGPLISIAKAAIPAVIAAAPYIKQAVEDGKSAIEAGEAASPGLKDIFSQIISLNNGEAGATISHVENAVRGVLNLPPMTSDQAMAWGWDDRWKNDANSGA